METPLSELLLTPPTVPPRLLSDVETLDSVLEVPLSALEMYLKLAFRSSPSPSTRPPLLPHADV